MVALRGGWPLGGLVAGCLADRFSAPHVMAVNGLLMALIAASIFLVGRGQSLQNRVIRNSEFRILNSYLPMIQ